MALPPGQVHALFLWVHPQWKLAFHANHVVENELREYKEFIDKLEETPHIGLVQIASRSRTEYSRSRPYRNLIEGLHDVDDYAAEKLGSRYLRWERSRFIDGKDPAHQTELVRHFHLLKEDRTSLVHERECDPDMRKHLSKIWVFGKELDTCPLHQAYNLSLHTLAADVRYYRQETPGGITIPRATDHHVDSAAIYVPVQRQ